jgi:predicted HNH restriction endonuclease
MPRDFIVKIHYGRDLTFEEAIQHLTPLCPNCHRIAHAKPVAVRLPLMSAVG